MRRRLGAIHALMLLATLTLVQQCQGHGYLYDPPSRSSMWRYGYSVRKNYDDNALRCGGSRTECGVCGDPVNGPRDNEAGGKYASGIISRNYTEGQVISVDVVITANHKGYFEFTLCPHDDPSTPVTETCLLNNVLELASGGTRYPLAAGITGQILIDVKLPVGITCTQCVLRWRWKTGNSWGTDPVTGKSGIGLGEQELFYGCADVSIIRDTRAVTAAPTTTKSVTAAPATTRGVTAAPATTRGVTAAPATTKGVTAAPATTKGVTAAPATTKGVTAAPTTTRGVTAAPATTKSVTAAPATTKSVTAAPATTKGVTAAPATSRGVTAAPATTKGVTVSPTPKKVKPLSRLSCQPVNIWVSVSGMFDWCSTNCNMGFCPPSHCICQVFPRNRGLTCHPVHIWAKVDGMVDFCNDNCNKSFCPPEYCSCV